MCLDNRQYTPAAVAELQTIALVCELRRRIAIRRNSLSNVIRNGSSVDAAMAAAATDSFEQVLTMLNELALDYSQCDNPPPEQPTLADYTAGMMEE